MNDPLFHEFVVAVHFKGSILAAHSVQVALDLEYEEASLEELEGIEVELEDLEVSLGEEGVFVGRGIGFVVSDGSVKFVEESGDVEGKEIDDLVDDHGPCDGFHPEEIGYQQKFIGSEVMEVEFPVDLGLTLPEQFLREVRIEENLFVLTGQDSLMEHGIEFFIGLLLLPG